MVSTHSYASHCWSYAAQHWVTRCKHPREVFRGCSANSEVVVGVGGVGIDYLASVATFPKPDQKLRTDMLGIQGGGNCGNSMTGVARLGLKSRILSTVGTDSLGDAVVSEFQEDGVSTEFLNRQEGAATPFTYIIVDESGGTRTCIHTPGAALRPEDVTPDLCEKLLKDAALVYFDGRLTEAAFVVARAAKAAQIPILVEAERLRADLDMLMAEADYIVTSSHFPEDWTGEDNVGDAILATLLRLPAVKFMVTTFGKQGAVLLKRVENPSGDEPEATLESVICDLRGRLDKMPSPGAAGGEPGCVAGADIPIFPGNIVKTEQPVTLTFDRTEQKAREALSKALAASQREAAANADLGNADNYLSDAFLEDGELSDTGDALGGPEDQTVTAEVYACSASPLSREHLVDSTGAGDAFIASILYGLVKGKSYPDILTLATVVAARKCTELGARPGVPRRDQLAAHLL